MLQLNTFAVSDERVRMAQLNLVLSLLKPSLQRSRQWEYPPHRNFLAIDLLAREDYEDGYPSSTVLLHQYFANNFDNKFRMLACTKVEPRYKAINRAFYDSPVMKTVLDRKSSPLEDVKLWVGAQGIDRGVHACGIAVCIAEGVKEGLDCLDVYRYLDSQTETDRVDMVMQLDLGRYKADRSIGRNWAQAPVLNFIDQFAVKRNTFVSFPINYRADLITLVGVNHTYPMDAWARHNVYSYPYWRANFMRWMTNG